MLIGLPNFDCTSAIYIMYVTQWKLSISSVKLHVNKYIKNFKFIYIVDTVSLCA